MMSSPTSDHYYFFSEDECEQAVEICSTGYSFKRLPSDYQRYYFFIFLKETTGEVERIIRTPKRLFRDKVKNTFLSEKHSVLFTEQKISLLHSAFLPLDKFEAYSHLNDSLGRSLISQLRVLLSNQRVVEETISYFHSLMGTLLEHLLFLEELHQENRWGIPCKITPRQLDKIKNYVQTHLDEKINIPILYRLCGLSEGYFYVAFKQATGLTPHQYITSVRMKEAKRLLLQSKQSIIQTGMAVGYENPAHFCQVFKKEAGVSPRKFRKKYRNTSSS